MDSLCTVYCTMGVLYPVFNIARKVLYIIERERERERERGGGGEGEQRREREGGRTKEREREGMTQ